MTTVSSYEILIGTYEEFVLGYQLIKSEDVKNKYSLTQTFVTHSHTASVRSVAATSKLAASSGADETVVLYDMVKRKQSGALMQHEGTITCLKFTPEGSHLISCSDDGSIAIFRVGSWQLEKLFKKAHKGTAVNHIAIHPSGKLALSVGKDKTLRTWNLVKGRPAYITNLSSYGVAFDNIDSVVWSPEGNLYAIPIQTKADVFSVAKGGVVHTLQSKCKVHCVCFLDENTVVTGNEESMITCYDLSDDGSVLWSKKATSSRIKGLSRYEHHLVAITSAGDLIVYDTSDVSKEPDVIASSNDGCRFTCLTIRPPIISESTDPTTEPPKKKKKKNAVLDPNATSDDISNEEIETFELTTQDVVKPKTAQRKKTTKQSGEKTVPSDDDEEVETVNVSMDGGRKRRKKTRIDEEPLNVATTRSKEAKRKDVDVNVGKKDKTKKGAVVDRTSTNDDGKKARKGGKIAAAVNNKSDDKTVIKKSEKAVVKKTIEKKVVKKTTENKSSDETGKIVKKMTKKKPKKIKKKRIIV